MSSRVLFLNEPAMPMAWLNLHLGLGAEAHIKKGYHLEREKADH